MLGRAVISGRQLGRLSSGMSLALCLGLMYYRQDKLQLEPISSRGVYFWGSNRLGIIEGAQTVVKEPQSLPGFEGKRLRDVVVSQAVAAAVLASGDVVRFDGRRFETIVRGKNVCQVQAASDGRELYCLARDGSLYQWMEETGVNKVECGKLNWFERITQIQTGQGHVVCATSQGRVLAGSTRSGSEGESKGQFGLASFSQFEHAPATGRLYEVSLLNGHRVVEIACGRNHTVVRTDRGRAFVFGDNTFGQLAVPFALKTQVIGAPRELDNKKVFGPDSQVTGVVAAGDMTIFKVKTTRNNGSSSSSSSNSSNSRNNSSGQYERFYSCGNGIKGNLGTGKFVHSQPVPSPLALGKMQHYDETQGQVVDLGISNVALSDTHGAVTLATVGDVLVWGDNEHYQLGTGRRSREAAPRSVPGLAGTQRMQVRHPATVYAGHDCMLLYARA